MLLSFGLKLGQLSFEVPAHRAQISERVALLFDVSEGKELHDAGELPLLPVEELRAILEDESLMTRVEGMSKSNAGAVLRDVERALRRQTARISTELQRYWSQIEGMTVALLVLATGLLGWVIYARARLADAGERLTSRRSPERAREVGGTRLAALGVGLVVTDSALELQWAGPALGRLRRDWDNNETWWADVLAVTRLPTPTTCPTCGHPERWGVAAAAVRAPSEGGQRWFELGFAGHAHDLGGQAVLVQETTAHRALEQTAVDSDRLSLLGTMAAGVAQEIDRPLTWLTGNLNELQTHLDMTDPRASELLSDALEGASRVRTITNDLSELTALEHGGDQLVRIDTVVERASRMAHALIRERCAFEIEVELSLPSVRGDGDRLGQVLLNLINNAVQALPGDGEGHRIILRAVPAGSGVNIEVEDDGPGIPAHLMDGLFEPNAMGSQHREGAGVGLFISKRIVTAHGGRITFDTRPGRTVVRVWLPPGSHENGVAEA